MQTNKNKIYSRVALWRGPIHHDIIYVTAMTGAELKSDPKLATGIPYLALPGELWVVYCEDLGENWPRYNGTALYCTMMVLGHQNAQC